MQLTGMDLKLLAPTTKSADAGGPNRFELPLTAAQLSIWIDQALHPDKPVYNTGQVITINSPIDKRAFERALQAVVARHDALRLRFCSGATIRQTIQPHVHCGLLFHDFSESPHPESDAEEWILQQFWRPLRPTANPLFAFCLAQVSANQFLWLQKYHHLVIDASGRQIVARQVAEVYNSLVLGGEVTVAHAPSFADIVDRDAAYHASEQYAVDKAYWSNRFADPVPPLVDRANRIPDKTTKGRASRVKFRFDDSVVSNLKVLAKQHDTSLFKLLLLFIWITLYRKYDRTDIVVGVPLGSRKTTAEKATVGLIAKLIPFRLELHPDETLGVSLAALSAQFERDLRHQQYPLDHISRGCSWRARANIGIFDVVLNYVRADYQFRIGSDEIMCRNLSSGFSVPWGFMGLEYSGHRDIALSLDYDSGLLDRSDVQRVTGQLQRLLAADLTCPDITLRELAWSSGETEPPAGDGPLGRATPHASMVRSLRAEGAGVINGQAAGEITSQLNLLWQNALGALPDSADVDFFASGGNSLSAICLMAECSQIFGLDLPLTALFEHPTPRSLGAAIEKARRTMCKPEQPRLVKLKDGGALPPLILVHPVGGTVTCYRDLVASLPEARPIYGLRVAGLYDGEEMATSLEAMAGEYLNIAYDAIGSVAFHLAGWSFGGVIAFEMARAAKLRGYAPRSLTLIDTPYRVHRGAIDDYSTLASVVGAALGLKPLGSTIVPKTRDDVVNMMLVAYEGSSRLELERFIRSVLAVVENAQVIRRDHMIKPYDGDVTLIEAMEEWRRLDLNCAGWKQYILGHVRSIRIAARRDTIVFPPFAADVAAILNDTMTQSNTGTVGNA